MSATSFAANRSVLAEAALRYVIAGWPIVPVRLPAPCHSPSVPLRALASHRPPADVSIARDWWTDETYGIAVLAGIAFDVLAVPAHLGPTTVELLRRSHPCAAAHPGGWWLFLVTRGAPTLTDLPRGSGISILGAGTQVLVPPTPTTAGPVEWAARTVGLAEVVAPDSHGWQRLPHGMTAQQAAARAHAVSRQPPRSSGRLPAGDDAPPQ